MCRDQQIDTAQRLAESFLFGAQKPYAFLASPAENLDLREKTGNSGVARERPRSLGKAEVPLL